uniref:Uncharacterized protein n=1 Tax=Trypanosoma congolense (strain IL3000) TaxID=1068625 RepID=G0UZR0_TRYCI|nr:conserved hypothetical protein [Trypanosoma congolense IL3000]
MRPAPPAGKANGTKPCATLVRPPAPPPMEDTGPEIAVVGSRVACLLRDARAVVGKQRRASTPPKPLTKFPPKRVTRLTSLTITPAVVDPPQEAVSQQRADPGAFLSALDAAKGSPEQQLERLSELRHWLREPQNILRNALCGTLVDLVLSLKTDPRVSVRAASILLHHCDASAFPSLPVVSRRLHELCEVGLEGHFLEDVLLQEELIQPMIQLLSNEELLLRQPSVLWDILEAFKSCSNNEAVMGQMATLGAIPGVNSLVQNIMQLFGDPSSFPSEVSPANKNLTRSLLSPACLLLREFSTSHSQQLYKLGSLGRIVDILERFRDDVDVVEAAARTMARVVSNDTCLEYYRDNIHTCSVVVAALEANMEIGGIIVTRLCSVLARLVECSREIRDWFMERQHQTLLRLVRTHIVQLTAANEDAESYRVDPEAVQQEELLQSVTWLVGVAMMSSSCSTAFVREITPLLVGFLKDFNVSKWHLTFIYTLMCLSNLSFFFAALEKAENGPSELRQLYETLGPILAGVIFDGDAEATVEATRVLGNISLTNVGRDWMESNRCDEVCIVFLGHEDPRIVYNCFGVLLNLTAADTCRAAADPDLTQTILQHTARYTRAETIAEEKEREFRRRQGSTVKGLIEGVSYTDQIADVVEKLLLNISGLILS